MICLYDIMIGALAYRMQATASLYHDISDKTNGRAEIALPPNISTNNGFLHKSWLIEFEGFFG